MALTSYEQCMSIQSGPGWDELLGVWISVLSLSYCLFISFREVIVLQIFLSCNYAWYLHLAVSCFTFLTVCFAWSLPETRALNLNALCRPLWNAMRWKQLRQLVSSARPILRICWPTDSASTNTITVIRDAAARKLHAPATAECSRFNLLVLGDSRKRKSD